MSFDTVNYAEDFLPDGQHAIQTSNLINFREFSNLLIDPGSRYLRMGVVTGAPGTGKTTAIQAFLDSLKASSHTGLPSAVRIKVKPKSTQKALAIDIVSAVSDKTKGRNSYELADEAAHAIIRNDLQLIFVDEADRLTDETFDLLRHVHDKSGCPIVVVGLKPILQVIDRQDKFGSRITIRMQFLPLKREEVLTTVLPQLIFPYWNFDPSDTRDLEMGNLLWSVVSPSLRKLRNVIEISSRIAELGNRQRIDLDVITEAFRWTASEEELSRLDQPKAARAPKSAEQISERRNEAKRRKQIR